MADFRRRPPHEFDHLSDQELVDYLDEARESGDGQAQREALGYLAWAFEPNIRARVAAKVPVEAIDDVVMEVFLARPCRLRWKADRAVRLLRSCGR